MGIYITFCSHLIHIIHKCHISIQRTYDICHIVSQHVNMLVSQTSLAIGWHSICMIRGEQRSEMNININRK